MNLRKNIQKKDMKAAFGSLLHWLWIFWAFSGLQAAEIETMYVSPGTDVVIKCPNDDVNSWQYCKSKELLAVCENGQNRINPALNLSNRINVTSECQLKIDYFTSDDLGTYLCVAHTNDTNNYQISVQPRSIKINDANNSIIRGIEGFNVTLTCSVLGGMAGDTLFWTRSNELLSVGSTSSLNYTFKANRSFDMKEFVCMANNTKDLYPLEARVQLNLVLKPKVSITVFLNSRKRNEQKSIQVRQGNYVQLQCQDKSVENEDVEMSWFLNGILLPNNSNKVVIEQIKPDRSGEYTCTVRNKAGTDFAAVNITVTYFPIVRCENVTFNDRDRLRTLECKVSGEPNTYNFSWFHYSYHNQLVRMFNNTNNRALTLPTDDSNDLWYEDSGFYTCNVTNGIPDDSGNLWQTGKIVVIIEGIPVLVRPRKYKYIGHFDETSSISISVLSSSKVLKADWFDERQMYLHTRSCVSSVIEAEAFGKLMNVSSYKCEYVIKNTTEDDFQNYTVKIANQFGENAFDVSLVSAREADKPTNIRLQSTTNHIHVEFKPGFNGGSAQNILIEYRKASAGTWIRLEIENIWKHYFITNLEPSTKYELRMYAVNKLGNSTVAGVYSIFTKDETNDSSTTYLSFAIGFVVLACLFILWWRFRKAKRNDAPRSSANEQQIQGVGVIVNNMYGSAVDLSASASREDVYSSIERRRQNLDRQEVTYKIAGEGKSKKFRRTDRKERNRNNERGSSKLNYIDIVFDPKPYIGKFYIHGADNRTPYADVDFSAKAEPLISSDENDESSVCGEDNADDYVSLEDVQQWNITED